MQISRTIEERRPAAPTLKLGGTLVQRRVACSTGVDAVLVELIKLPGAGALGALLPKDPELLQI